MMERTKWLETKKIEDLLLENFSSTNENELLGWKDLLYPWRKLLQNGSYQDYIMPRYNYYLKNKK